jgi:tripartite-type tricarboxylate transporter receptor subunit TctC
MSCINALNFLVGRLWVAPVFGVVLAISGALPAGAQGEYPARPLTMVVPGPPGGITDLLGRLIAGRLTERLGQRVLVDNKAGAGGNLAAEFVARAPRDGYVMLMGTQGTQVANQYLYKSLSFDAAKDFVPVNGLLSISSVLVVNSDRPYRSIKDLVDFAKQNPGKLAAASAGNGTSTHLVSELFQAAAGISFLHVPYKGNTPAITDLLGGQVDLAFDFPAATLGHIEAGKLRALVVTSPTRVAALPDVPTTAEVGYPQAQAVAWIGLFLPAGTPDKIVTRLQAEIAGTLQESAVAESIVKLGGTPFNLGGQAFGAFIQSEHGKWKSIIERSGAKLD